MIEPSVEQILSNKENLLRILDNLKEGIIAHDIQRRIFFFNQEAERITGYTRSEVLGKDCHEAFGAPFCGEYCSFCDDYPVVVEPREYTINAPSKSGEPRRVEFRVSPMCDESGEIFGVLASMRDITDLFCLQMRAEQLTRFANIVGRDSKMLQLFQQIRDVADYDYPVHISGETGTGKELVAAAIHSESRRGGAPFVPINCGALPEGLLESELFGHVKGAFSGAIRDKKGRFELADGGTIFLDEVAELSRTMQVKLLRFLQEGRLERVGGEETVAVDVRVISATNRDLAQEVRRKHFRDDLYYRLNVIPIHIPPLRERKTDIPLLVAHFLKEAGERHQRRPPQVSKEALAILLDYAWPGNVRELQNAVQYAIVKGNGNTITPSDLPMELARRKAASRSKGRRGPSKKLRAEAVKAALVKTGGNKSKAARLLGVGRATLYRFLDDHPEIERELPLAGA
jgi:PAS domain S-box-containing protein